ncbi:MAG: hypothetical protein PHC97_04080 [Patescibacteria group bacterium]|nr:hypothetical protein [Patescibacteria group bacterium]
MNKTLKTILFILAFIVVFLAGIFSAYFVIPWIIFSQISTSNIVGNVPDVKNFDQFLQRDLNKYFSEKFGKEVEAKYELLRQGPTQTGVAFPKYYAWVILYSNNEELEQGAVRIAAIDKEVFDVTDYINVKEIKSDPTGIYNIFPSSVCDKINEKIKALQ